MRVAPCVWAQELDQVDPAVASVEAGVCGVYPSQLGGSNLDS